MVCVSLLGNCILPDPSCSWLVCRVSGEESGGEQPHPPSTCRGWNDTANVSGSLLWPHSGLQCVQQVLVQGSPQQAQPSPAVPSQRTLGICQLSIVREQELQKTRVLNKATAFILTLKIIYLFGRQNDLSLE